MTYVQEEWRQRRRSGKGGGSDDGHDEKLEADYRLWKAQIAPVVSGYCARIAALREKESEESEGALLAATSSEETGRC